MANVGNIFFEQIEGARGGVYYLCRADVQVGDIVQEPRWPRMKLRTCRALSRSCRTC
jgi:hypothetical protein